MGARYHTYDYVCTPVEDCSARDAAAAALAAAEANLQTAETNLENARALKASVEKEMNTVSDMLNNFESVYNVMMSVGPSVANPNNMNELSSSIECIGKYGGNVEGAYNQAKNEVQRCSSEVSRCRRKVENAKTKLANTPCVWKCV